MNFLSLRKTAVAAVVGFLVLAGATSSMAAAKLKVDLPNSDVAAGDTVNVPIMISGFTFPELSVTLKVDSGTLTVEDAGSVLSLSPGYNSLVDQAEISFHGMATDVVSALDTSVKWTAADAGALLIGVSVGEYEAGRTYDPTTGHSYKFVNTPLSWSEARDAAKLMTYKGKSGYLPSISTASENTFVANKSGADDIWIGTTADLTYVNSARTAAGLPLIVDDTKVKGEHYWVGGNLITSPIKDTVPVTTIVELPSA